MSLRDDEMPLLTKLSNLELLDFPDCVALLETGKCAWLDVCCCKGATCSFLQQERARPSPFSKRIRDYQR